jgi:phosphoglucomutase
MSVHPLAGQPAAKESLVNVPELVTRYFVDHPDPEQASQRIAFGTSGHRGSALHASFNDDHIAAVCQALVEYRVENSITGPLFLGKDTHALSEAAFATALEVFAANEVQLVIDEGAYTPTPALSHAVVSYNRGRTAGLADGVVITPSHNPPEDGGFKYNPPSGGPAEPVITAAIEARANALLSQRLKGVQRIPVEQALRAATTRREDLCDAYVADLGSVLDLGAVRDSGLRIGVDPLGGSRLAYWDAIADRYGIDITVVNRSEDPTFSFMSVDWDGKIRMDCSSAYAMAGLIRLKDRFDIAFGSDPDADRHGIVTPSAGLMNPNHYLAVAVDYLFRNRPEWREDAAVGKTLVSSSMIDRVAAHLGRELVEVPVGFKWFVEGLQTGALGFGGEESAGAAFLRRDGTTWTTDKDGILLCLLAAEVTARTGQEPGLAYRELEERFGSPVYQRIDAPANAAQKAVLKELSPGAIEANELAGDAIVAKLTRAPGNEAAIGGLKVVTAHGWFAARPSGTEDVYKIYAESFRGEDHLHTIQEEAQAIVATAFRASGVS